MPASSERQTPSPPPTLAATRARTRFCQRLAVVLLVTQGGVMLACWRALPERMAVHFGADGAADGWQSKGDYFLSMGIMLLALNLFIGLGIPWLTARLGERWINVCWKKYWFSTPARRAEILARLGTIAAVLLINLNAIFLIVNMLVVHTNLQPGAKSLPVAPVLALIVGLTAVCIGATFYLQRPPPDDYRRWQAGQLPPPATRRPWA